MNKNIALTIVAVILLGMVLVVYNEYTTKPMPNINGMADAQDTSQEPSPIGEDEQGLEQSPAQDTAEKNDNDANALEQDAQNINESSKDAPLALKAPSSSAQDESEQARPSAPPPAEKPARIVIAPPVIVNPSPFAADTSDEPVKVEAKEPVKAKEEAKPAPKPKSVKVGAKEIRKITVSTIGDGVTVRIDSLQTPAYKAMRLKSPERIVLDLNGDWKVVAPGVPKNEFVSNVRIGQQKDGTRIVIDLFKSPASIRYLKYGETGLDVRIR